MIEPPIMPRIAFLYINSYYSSIGGIQKFNRNFIVALQQLGKSMPLSVHLLSLLDRPKDLQEVKGLEFQSAYGNNWLFVAKAIVALWRCDIIFLGHTNLCFPITLLNALFFRKKIYVFAHGVGVWRPFMWHKRLSVKLSKILAVSEYTQDRMSKAQNISKDIIGLFYNSLDPEVRFSIQPNKPEALLQKYNLEKDDLVILTLTRLSYTEKNKGYDKILHSLPKLLETFPKLRYLLAGKIDAEEQQRLEQLIQSLNLSSMVRLIGFVKDEDVADLYQCCDLFVMPSTKEGFGIVFIEALASGKPVIGGNQDGSVEALQNGLTGYLVNPNHPEEIEDAILKFFKGEWSSELTNPVLLRDRTLEAFGFEHFVSTLKEIIVKR